MQQAMKQVQRAQAEMAKVQEELASETVEASAGGGITAGAERLIDHRTRLGPLPRHGSAVIPIIEATGLQGRGGAGFPAGLKWEMARNAPGNRRYVLCNADEGDPGMVLFGLLYHPGRYVRPLDPSGGQRLEPAGFSIFQRQQTNRRNLFLQRITQINGNEIMPMSGDVQRFTVCFRIGLKIRQ